MLSIIASPPSFTSKPRGFTFFFKCAAYRFWLKWLWAMLLGQTPLCRTGASFQIFLGGGRDGLAIEASLISRGICGGWGGGGVAVSLTREDLFILSYFLCFLKPHEQGISANISTKMNSSKARDPLKINFLSLASLPWLRPSVTKKVKKKRTQY